MHAPPFISLGQALDLGLGAERKQNKSLPVSSSNSAHSNSSHSQSSQRERQPTTGRNYLFIRLVFLGGFFMRIFFNPESFFFFFSSPEQNGMKRKRPPLKSETKKSRESWNISKTSDEVCGGRGRYSVDSASWWKDEWFSVFCRS